MISEKMLELGKKRSLIREIFEYGKKRGLEIGADKVFDFSIGNPNV
ncbi:MAG: pyridoxal phosphate-dependent aminotransferase, partial [Synergistaceae bacterium]|nr:pyridoxal phosphate-dependent aminotransferase [Synergistaceae bacterium]